MMLSSPSLTPAQRWEVILNVVQEFLQSHRPRVQDDLDQRGLEMSPERLIEILQEADPPHALTALQKQDPNLNLQDPSQNNPYSLVEALTGILAD
jgi:hypothetical protein